MGAANPKGLVEKVIGYTCQDTEEMGFEVVYGYRGCITLVASRWHQFHIKFASVADVILHVFWFFIVEDMFLRVNACPFQLEQE